MKLRLTAAFPEDLYFVIFIMLFCNELSTRNSKNSYSENNVVILLYTNT